MVKSNKRFCPVMIALLSASLLAVPVQKASADLIPSAFAKSLSCLGGVESIDFDWQKRPVPR